jgi:carboxyl-terminal processing protease
MKKTLMGAVAGATFAMLAFALMTPNSLPGGAEARTNSNVYRQLDLFSDVFDQVRSKYVVETDDTELIRSSINGMLSALDPHSSYMSPEQFHSMEVSTSGEFGGLGIQVIMEDGIIKVVSPMDGTPAKRAGIESGDKITHIDGEAIKGMTMPEALERMRGPAGSDITVTIIRADQDAFDVSLERAVIAVESVRWRAIDDDIAYLRISTFSRKTDGGLQKAMASMKKEMGTGLNGVVLDLRSNPGGLLDQAVSVTDAFLERGEIVSTRGRMPKDSQRHNARSGDLADGKPMIILINGGSASASEIVAGALQDHGRATLLGTKSFGKGSVQTVIPLNNGADGALRLTTAKYYTPSGRSIHEVGIDPDVVVEYIPPAEDEDGNVITPADGELPADNQLDRAVELLHELVRAPQQSAAVVH